MKSLLIICLVTVLFSSCAHWTINGIPAKKIKDIHPQNIPEIAIGLGTSLLVHNLGHILYLEYINADYRLEGDKEICLTPITDHQGQMFARAGFVSQLLFGTVLSFTKFKNSWFAVGYHTGSVTEITLYPFWHYDYGDLQMIDRYSGDSEKEWSFYSTWSIGLLSTNDKLQSNKNNKSVVCGRNSPTRSEVFCPHE